MRCRPLMVLAVILGVTLAAGVATVYAQSAAGDPHHPAAAAPGAGGMAEPRDGNTMPMMEMCRQMMAGPMMGMSAEATTDPKMMAHMLAMRGEMMKAMGEVMMKHAKMMGRGATNDR